MAKRAPKSEQPFNALDKSLVDSVMTGSMAAAEVGRPQNEVGVAQTDLAAAKTRAEQAEENVVQLPRAQAPPVRRESPRANQDVAVVEKRKQEKRVLLTPSEEREIDRFVERFATEVGARIKLSHVLRAYYLLLMHAEDDILDRARRSENLARPGNGNPAALAEFEHGIATILSAAFRDAMPLR